jgi:hypothetical protein
VRLNPYNLDIMERRKDSAYAEEYGNLRAQHAESASNIAQLTARATGTTDTAADTATAAAASASSSRGELSWQELYENYGDRYTKGKSHLIRDPADELYALTVPAEYSSQYPADHL